MLSGSGMLTEKYCELGWKVVRLHGVNEDGSCTCRKGADCPSAGKHPVDRDWKETATSDADAVNEWDEGETPHNVGLLLGDIVDIEIDDEIAWESWAALGIGDVQTPTYTSGRGPHRLFKWREGLPDVAFAKPGGIECRLGGGGKSAQSVLPPSRYKDNERRYEWLPGLSPEDVEVAELPDVLFNAICEYVENYRPGQRTTGFVLDDKLKEGTRNNQLYAYACSELGKLRSEDGLYDEAKLREVHRKIKSANNSRCTPPLHPREVEAVFASALGFIQGDFEKELGEATIRRQVERKEGPRTYEGYLQSYGLEMRLDDRGNVYWGPGQWKLVYVDADPLYWELEIPGYPSVPINPRSLQSPTEVAHEVAAHTGRVLLNADPKKWRKAWLNQGHLMIDEARTPVLGLMQLLVGENHRRKAHCDEFRMNELLGIFIETLNRALDPGPDDLPDPDGRPTWRADGTIWLRWQPHWRRLRETHRHIIEGEPLKVGKVLAKVQGRSEKLTVRHEGHNYCIVSRADLERMRSLAAGEPL